MELYFENLQTQSQFKKSAFKVLLNAEQNLCDLEYT